MSKSPGRYGTRVPEKTVAILSTFEGRSGVAHLSAGLLACLVWAGGSVLLGEVGSLVAFATAGVGCGLVLGVAFTRALGGPVLNLLASLFCPGLLAGTGTVAGVFPVAMLYRLDVELALVLPSFLVTLGCMLAWFSVLGPDRIEGWSRRHLPAAFLTTATDTSPSE
ncbi:hypothetical protein [Haloarchaeobius amylolyticus]|uniref:hypothetical protein n=1 Tax=Haloarchaeobius amylolyticus TaxID=1198296 RepID=UPI002271389C|nr:hypothetical protein [Haloarchaeobius amylolyticus]